MELKRNVKLKNLSSFRIGGEAKFFKEATDTDDLINSVDEIRRQSLPFFILGGGTNILWDDKGFEGLVVKPSLKKLIVGEEGVRVGAGVLMTELTDLAIGHGLTGLEWAGGLPGTLGGAIRGNAGAFGGEIKDVINEVISLDTKSLKILKRSNTECAFGYRASIFKTKGGEIIVEAVLSLSPGVKREIKTLTEERIRYRKVHHPLEHPNVGSIFKNIALKNYPDLDKERFKNVIKTDPFPVIPTAFLISETGLKGVSCGGAVISPKHPNFIVNVLNASSEDVKNLIALVKFEIFDDFGIELEEEILIM